jgi:hypothetical protein
MSTITAKIGNPFDRFEIIIDNKNTRHKKMI